MNLNSQGISISPTPPPRIQVNTQRQAHNAFQYLWNKTWINFDGQMRFLILMKRLGLAVLCFYNPILKWLSRMVDELTPDLAMPRFSWRSQYTWLNTASIEAVSAPSNSGSYTTNIAIEKNWLPPKSSLYFGQLRHLCFPDVYASIL